MKLLLLLYIETVADCSIAITSHDPNGLAPDEAVRKMLDLVKVSLLPIDTVEPSDEVKEKAFSAALKSPKHTMPWLKAQMTVATETYLKSKKVEPEVCLEVEENLKKLLTEDTLKAIEVEVRLRNFKALLLPLVSEGDIYRYIELMRTRLLTVNTFVRAGVVLPREIRKQLTEMMTQSDVLLQTVSKTMKPIEVGLVLQHLKSKLVTIQGELEFLLKRKDLAEMANVQVLDGRFKKLRDALFTSLRQSKLREEVYDHMRELSTVGKEIREIYLVNSNKTERILVAGKSNAPEIFLYVGMFILFIAVLCLALMESPIVFFVLTGIALALFVVHLSLVSWPSIAILFKRLK
jgi:hypothetical protein